MGVRAASGLLFATLAVVACEKDPEPAVTAETGSPTGDTGPRIDRDGDGIPSTEDGGEDCDDTDADVFPGAPDRVGDGVDQGCDGIDGEDRDGDGAASLRSGGDDCDDRDDTVAPGADEVWYDGIDQDCDGACDGDQDGDGSVVVGWEVADGDPCDAEPTPGVFWAHEDCDDLDPAAAAILDAIRPSDGAVGISTGVPVSATLDQADATAVLDLYAGGLAVAGSLRVDRTTVTFVPDEPLALDTRYDATLTWGCGTETWSFTTTDGVSQSIRHSWTVGPPDVLAIEVEQPVASQWELALAETGAAAVGWYGEDCFGPYAFGLCHPMSGSTLALESVFPMPALVVPGSTTLFDASFDAALTYALVATDGPRAGDCWAWGEDPAYFPGCTPL